MAKQQGVEVNLGVDVNSAFENIEVKPAKPADAPEETANIDLIREWRAYLGDRWWHLKAGEHNVPLHVKSHLLAHGLLRAK